MEWCISYHRTPEKVLRPREYSLRYDVEPRATGRSRPRYRKAVPHQSERAGGICMKEEVPRSRCGHAHELAIDVPPRVEWVGGA